MYAFVRRIASPTASSETIELVAVEATDAQSASVTTSDGRAFATADGGATWNRR